MKFDGDPDRVSEVVSGFVDDWTDGVGSNAVGKNAVVASGRIAGIKSVIAGTVAELAAAFASTLLADFELRSPELALVLGLSARFDAVLEPDSESTLVSDLGVAEASDFAPSLAFNFDADVAARDWLWRCSGRELDMYELSAALKFVAGSGLFAVEAACVAIEIGSASTCIGVPQV